MKTVKTLLAASLLAAGTMTAAAQATYTDQEGNDYQFKKHLFLDLQAGGQYTLGEGKFGDMLSPNFQIGLGYQFSPAFAMRLQANGLQSRGGWSGYRDKVGDQPFTAKYKFNYVAPGLDFMLNLSNLFCGWNPNRVLNVTAFLGAGVNVAYGNDEVQDIAANLQNLNNYNLQYLWDGTKARPFGRGGVDISIRVSKGVSIMLEGNANVLTDKYNSKKAGNSDWYFNALAGVRINLGKSKKSHPYQEPVQPAPVVENKYVEPTPAPQPEVKKKKEEIRRDIHFKINSSVVNQAGKDKIKELADFMKNHEDAKLTIVGYADKNTGTAAYNKRISERRALSVFNILTKEYGIQAHRISYTFKGDVEQPFASNDDNRVAICVGTAE